MSEKLDFKPDSGDQDWIVFSPKKPLDEHPLEPPQEQPLEEQPPIEQRPEPPLPATPVASSTSFVPRCQPIRPRPRRLHKKSTWRVVLPILVLGVFVFMIF